MKNLIAALLTVASLSIGCHKTSARHEFTMEDACRKFYRLNESSLNLHRHISLEQYLPICMEYSEEAKRQLPPEEWKRQLVCVEKGDNQLDIAVCINGK